MVSLSFSRPDHDSIPVEILRMTVVYGQEVNLRGDSDWIDWDFKPHSNKLGRPVSFNEDPEEWARSLPAAYGGSGMIVEVIADSSPQQQIADHATKQAQGPLASTSLEAPQPITLPLDPTSVSLDSADSTIPAASLAKPSSKRALFLLLAIGALTLIALGWLVLRPAPNERMNQAGYKALNTFLATNLSLDPSAGQKINQACQTIAQDSDPQAQAINNACRRGGRLATAAVAIVGCGNKRPCLLKALGQAETEARALVSDFDNIVETSHLDSGACRQFLATRRNQIKGVATSLANLRAAIKKNDRNDTLTAQQSLQLQLIALTGTSPEALRQQALACAPK